MHQEAWTKAWNQEKTTGGISHIRVTRSPCCIRTSTGYGTEEGEKDLRAGLLGGSRWENIQGVSLDTGGGPGREKRKPDV